MKLKTLFFAVLIPVQLLAQKEIKIIKIDNSGFPKIEMIIKAEKKTDTSKLSIYENNKKIQFAASDIPFTKIKQDKRLLYLLPDFDYEKLRKELSKEIKGLKKNDMLNVGIMYKTKKGKTVIQYLSPVFSKNKSFFISYLENKTPGLLQNDNCNYQKAIQDELFSENSELKSTGIIIIGNFEDFELNFCTGMQKKVPAPIYILQTKLLKKEIEDKLIDICMNSGGMYTQSSKNRDFKKILERYKEDISLETQNTKSNLKSIIFRVTENKAEVQIKISYNRISQSFTIKKPEQQKFSGKEIYLTIFSSVLLLITLFLLAKNKKYRNKKDIINSETPDIEPVIVVKPIEINIKGKGLNKTYFFEKHLIRIGRNPDNDIVIPDATVSGNHAIINKQSQEFVIQDLGSTNGVVVNKKKVKKQTLKTKDQIKLGAVVLFVRF